MTEILEIGAAYLVGLACGACLVCFFVGANRQKHPRET